MSTSTVHSDVYSTGKAEKIGIEKSLDEIRKGNGYYISSLINTGANIMVYTLIRGQKSTTKYHLSFKIINGDIANPVTVFLIEGTGSVLTGSHAATILIPLNLNRTAPTGSILFQRGIVTGSTNAGTGSLIYISSCPAFGILKFGSSESRQNEMLIDATQTYLLAYSGASYANVAFEAFWYEE
jgi:hypothetical protein